MRGEVRGRSEELRGVLKGEERNEGVQREEKGWDLVKEGKGKVCEGRKKWKVRGNGNKGSL